MAKTKKTPKPKTPKAPKPDAASVPCLRVVVGGKQGSAGQVDAKSCAIVGESRGAAVKFELGRKFGATSKSVSTPKKNKPCLGARKRKGCPVQLVFDKGQPFLRFCTADKQAGYRVDVATPAEAVARANAACATYASTGKFDLPETTPLGRTRKS